MNKINEFFTNAVNTAKTKASEFLNSVINVIKNLPGQIGNWFSQTIQKVVSWGSDMVSKGHQAASGLFNAIVNKVREIHQAKCYQSEAILFREFGVVFQTQLGG